MQIYDFLFKKATIFINFYLLFYWIFFTFFKVYTDSKMYTTLTLIQLLIHTNLFNLNENNKPGFLLNRQIKFILNNDFVDVEVNPATVLLDFIRTLRLTGTKEGCKEGDLRSKVQSLRGG
jgi:hypothetical protein